MILWKNKICGGRKSESLYAPIYHMPTLLSLAGLEVPGFADGMDLSNVVLGKGGAEREEANDDFRSGTDYIDWFDDERKIVRTARGAVR